MKPYEFMRFYEIMSILSLLHSMIQHLGSLIGSHLGSMIQHLGSQLHELRITNLI